MVNKLIFNMDIDDSVYTLVSKASIILIDCGYHNYAEQLAEELNTAHSYDGVLRRISKYFKIVPTNPNCAELNRLIQQIENKN